MQKCAFYLKNLFKNLAFLMLIFFKVFSFKNNHIYFKGKFFLLSRISLLTWKPGNYKNNSITFFFFLIIWNREMQIVRKKRSLVIWLNYDSLVIEFSYSCAEQNIYCTVTLLLVNSLSVIDSKYFY